MSRITLILPPELREQLLLASESTGIPVNQFLREGIAKMPSLRNALRTKSRIELAAQNAQTKIPVTIVRLMLRERSQDPPTPYREIARVYGYGVRTVFRAVNGQGGYRKKITQGTKGRKKVLTKALMAELVASRKTMKISELGEKYNVGVATVYRILKNANSNS
jgi:DNA invertase Pin-like site-specific DNA recombinase